MTNFQTPKTWLGHNATRYRILNALPHALPCIFSEIPLTLGYLQVTVYKYRSPQGSYFSDSRYCMALSQYST